MPCLSRTGIMLIECWRIRGCNSANCATSAGLARGKTWTYRRKTIAKSQSTFKPDWKFHVAHSSSIYLFFCAADVPYARRGPQIWYACELIDKKDIELCLSKLSRGPNASTTSKIRTVVRASEMECHQLTRCACNGYPQNTNLRAVCFSLELILSILNTLKFTSLKIKNPITQFMWCVPFEALCAVKHSRWTP